MASSTASRPNARFTVAEFHRLCEQLPERRLELIDGEVLEVIAKGSRHTAVWSWGCPAMNSASRRRSIWGSIRSLSPIWPW